MGKKKKRKKRGRAFRELPLAVLEKKARESLAAGKYRQARDYFKELCRHDRERYLSELIKAHEGVALQMIKEGRVNDARAVLDHINRLNGVAKKSRVELILSM